MFLNACLRDLQKTMLTVEFHWAINNSPEAKINAVRYGMARDPLAPVPNARHCSRSSKARVPYVTYFIHKAQMCDAALVNKIF